MPPTLLLVDDNVTIRRLIELTFADDSVRVDSVSSGRDAIARIEHTPPDIVLADAGMTDVSGYDIAAFIKGRADLQHIPVILLAGAFEPADEARVRASGSDGVLVKPFEPQMVVARVRELLPQSDDQAAVVEPPPTAVPVSASDALAADRLRQGSGESTEALRAKVDPVLETSLDRLDAAMEQSDTQTPDDAQMLDRPDFGDWDLPARPADRLRQGSGESAEALPPPITLAPKHARTAGARRPVPLADAFSSLLAAEEGRPHDPLPAPGAMSTDLTADDMDQIVDRLIERLGPSVRGAVIDLAERLVKAEIERLKALR